MTFQVIDAIEDGFLRVVSEDTGSEALVTMVDVLSLGGDVHAAVMVAGAKLQAKENSFVVKSRKPEDVLYAMAQYAFCL